MHIHNLSTRSLCFSSNFIPGTLLPDVHIRWGLHWKVTSTKSRFLIESLILTSCGKRVLFIHFDHRAALLHTKQMANAWYAVPPMGEEPQICLLTLSFPLGSSYHRSVSLLTINPHRDVSHSLLFVSEVISFAKKQTSQMFFFVFFYAEYLWII